MWHTLCVRTVSGLQRSEQGAGAGAFERNEVHGPKGGRAARPGPDAGAPGVFVAKRVEIRVVRAGAPRLLAVT